MPPRPFPFDLGIGTDIAHIPRFRRLLETPGRNSQPRLDQFLNRIFTLRERNDFWAKFKNYHFAVGAGIDGSVRYLAGRWAAKEAVVKAVQQRRLRLRDVEILRYPTINGQGGVFALILDERISSVQPSESHSSWTSTVEGAEKALRPSRRSHEEISDASEQPLESIEDEYPHSLSTEPLYGDLEGTIAKVSISHDGEYATAVALAPDGPLHEDPYL